MSAHLLGIGLTGTSLTNLEREIVRDTSPFAIVLFARNVESAGQLRQLVRDVKRTAKRPPLFMIDQEGGRVDRLRDLIPGLPGAEAVAESERPAEMARWLGRVIGMSLRWFDIEVDLAPVVDVRGVVAPGGLERRMFGSDPEVVAELAGAFLRGLHGEGVAGCLKHWPGIGTGSADSHYGATVIGLSPEEMRQRDLVPFARLAAECAAVMIGHGSYPHLESDPDLPATLSRALSTTLLREQMGFEGIAMTDDMEMHAVADLGSHQEITERALMAGSDVILFCSQIERIPDLDDFLQRRVGEDDALRHRAAEARFRCDAYRMHCDRLRGASAAPSSWEAVQDEAARFVDAFAAARGSANDGAGESEPSPGTGRTGREEWT